MLDQGPAPCVKFAALQAHSQLVKSTPWDMVGVVGSIHCAYQIQDRPMAGFFCFQRPLGRLCGSLLGPSAIVSRYELAAPGDAKRTFSHHVALRRGHTERSGTYAALLLSPTQSTQFPITL